MKSALLFATLAVALVGCQYSEMHPGDACGRCHGGEAPRFGAAGTLYSDPWDGEAVEGATIDVIDADGRTASMRSNDVGNFYTDTPIRPPFQIKVWKGTQLASMHNAMSGDCNRCHSGKSDGPGRIHLP